MKTTYAITRRFLGEYECIIAVHNTYEAAEAHKHDLDTAREPVVKGKEESKNWHYSHSIEDVRHFDEGEYKPYMLFSGLQKDTLVGLAQTLGVATSGTKADIASRLINQ